MKKKYLYSKMISIYKDKIYIYHYKEFKNYFNYYSVDDNHEFVYSLMYNDYYNVYIMDIEYELNSSAVGQKYCDSCYITYLGKLLYNSKSNKILNNEEKKDLLSIGFIRKIDLYKNKYVFKLLNEFIL